MSTPDYQRIEQAISFIERQAQRQPSLEEIAAHIGLSPFHFQRLFTRWAGVSPKRFLQHLTLDNARRLLRDSATVLETSLEVGLSGPGRLHDLFVAIDAVTPGEYKSFGRGLAIDYGVHPTPFGECLLGVTVRGICFLGFGPSRETLPVLRSTWPDAELRETTQRTTPVIERIFSTSGGGEPLQLVLHGTNFQLKVWEALLRIPAGETVSYQTLATAVGRPSASRAVGNAVGQNPIAYLIPCHRVLRTGGGIGGYRWGTPRKRAILALEAARHTPG